MRSVVNQLSQRLNQVRKRVDLASLQTRLTVGVAVIATVGIGTVAVWTGWKMQQILVTSHKQNVQYIASRFPKDVKYYGKQQPANQALQKAINSLSTDNVLLWVEESNGTVIARSEVLGNPNDLRADALLSLHGISPNPQVYSFHGRHLVLCRGPLVDLDGNRLGTLYAAQDITEEQTMLLAGIRSLGLASITAVIVIIVASALYTRRSLQPLRQISQLADTISADDLGEARLHLDHAPSEVRELAKTCNMMLDRLSDAWEQQRRLVSNVSHELRTPLTIVHGYLQSLMRRSTNLTEPQQEALSIASSEAERTISLLQDLLDLARAGSGHLHLHWERVVLNDLVAEVAVMARQFSNHAVEVIKPPLSIAVRADRNRLKQVLLNLLDNAVKYSKPQSPVVVVLEQQREKAVIQVRDCGAGIALQHQSRIFEPFYRVDEARTRSGGSGLGLSIVKTLVEGMNSTISVRSKPGEGSIFTIMIPMQSAKL